MKNFESQRERYTKDELVEDNIVSNPIELFQQWMVQAINHHVKEPNAMIMSTVDQDGQPEARTVLLKEIYEEGFVFYTNYNSNKAKQILANPKVSLLFLWLESERQVRISGTATKISTQKSKEYFQKRPRGSQIGAWTSPQSEVIPNRTFLTSRKNEIENQFAGVPILDKPDFWGGFKIDPQKIEFWQGRDNRLHDRLLFTKSEDSSWKIDRLAP